MIALVVAWFGLGAVISSLAQMHQNSANAVVATALSVEQQEKVRAEVATLLQTIKEREEKNDGVVAEYIRLGERFETLGQLALAQSAFEHALEHDPKNAQIHARYALVLQHREQYIAAEQAFLKSLTFDPGAIAVYGELAKLYVEIGDKSKARGVYLEGLVRSNNNAELMSEYVRFLESIGEQTEAKLYRDILTKSTTDAAKATSKKVRR